MAIQLMIWQRRDSGNREIIQNTALELCRIVRKREGITSSRFYWTSGTDELVFWSEGETAALDSPGQAAQADYLRLSFIMMDNAQMTINKRLADPRDATQNYRTGGRIK